MLKKRIIPIVLLDGFSVLKTVNFNTRRNLGSPVTVMRTYNTRNVDEMIILDIDASRSNRSIDRFVIQEISADCFMPLTVGGGIKTCQDIENILKAGADKISINSYAYHDPHFINEAVNNFGSQCIVASVDCIKNGKKYSLFRDNNIFCDIDFFEWLLHMQDLGAGEILVNDVGKDGTMSGCDINLAKKITDIIKIPVIFAGGVKSPENAADLVEEANVDAVGISSIFHFTDHTPNDCNSSLKARGISAR